MTSYVAELIERIPYSVFTFSSLFADMSVLLWINIGWLHFTIEATIFLCYYRIIPQTQISSNRQLYTLKKEKKCVWWRKILIIFSLYHQTIPCRLDHTLSTLGTRMLFYERERINIPWSCQYKSRLWRLILP